MKNVQRTWACEPHTFTCRREGQTVELTRDGIVLLEGSPAFFKRLARQIGDVAAGRPANSGRRWSPSDDEQLTVAHAAGASKEELAALLQRSTAAVVARLFGLGLTEEPGMTLRYPTTDA